MSLLAVVLIAGPASTRLVNLDTVAEAPRGWATEKLLAGGWVDPLQVSPERSARRGRVGARIEYLLFGCPYCLSFWVALPAALILAPGSASVAELVAIW
jgi:hypothetical protein